MTDRLTCANRPCGTCPYRKDVPSGVWEAHEYDKLPEYDGDTGFQPTAAFFCHQQDGKLCAGWVAAHGAPNLLSLRISHAMRGNVDPSVWTYKTDVPVFASGQEACDHGKRDIENPDRKARAKIAGLMKAKKMRAQT